MISRRIPLVVALLCVLLAAWPAASAAQDQGARSAHSKKHKRCPHGTKRVRKHGRVRCVRPKPVPKPAAPSVASQTPAASQPTPQVPAAAAGAAPGAESDNHVLAQVWADPSNGSVITPPSSGGGYVACSGGQATLVIWYQHGWVSENYWSSCGWYMRPWTDWTWWQEGYAQFGDADYPPVMSS